MEREKFEGLKATISKPLQDIYEKMVQDAMTLMRYENK